MILKMMAMAMAMVMVEKNDQNSPIRYRNHQDHTYINHISPSFTASCQPKIFNLPTRNKKITNREIWKLEFENPLHPEILLPSPEFQFPSPEFQLPSPEFQLPSPEFLLPSLHPTSLRRSNFPLSLSLPGDDDGVHEDHVDDLVGMPHGNWIILISILFLWWWWCCWHFHLYPPLSLYDDQCSQGEHGHGYLKKYGCVPAGQNSNFNFENIFCRPSGAGGLRLI